MSIIKKLAVFLSRRSRLKYKNECAGETGLILGEDFNGKDNHRLLNLFIRGFIVMAVTAGSIDGFMSAFNIPYNVSLVFAVLIALNIMLMLSQLHPILRIAAYAAVIWGVISFYGNNVNVLRSGLNAITNLAYELIRLKYKLPAVDGFDEIIADRGLTITVLVITGGSLYLVLLWEVCGRSMNLIITAMLSFAVISMGIFFGGVPGAFSVIMLTTAWILMACLKFNGKNYFTFSKKHQYKVYQWGQKQYYFKLIDGKVLAQLFALLLAFVVGAGSLLNMIVSPVVYEKLVPESEIKQFSDHVLKDVMIMAFSKYKHYKLQGSISNGQLGQYASVHPDDKPDLEITYIPTKVGRSYLKTFVGTDYASSGWTTRETAVEPKMTNMTAQAAKQAGLPHGRMKVKNLDVPTSTPFLPYYTDINSCKSIEYLSDTDIRMILPIGMEYEIAYYPGPDVTVDDSVYKQYIYDNFLDVPEENRELITELCKQKGFSKDDPELEQKIANYFETEFTYTLDPGLVPWKTDFVNYFLFENKEGVCAHFASAGTLMYRCIGIPARYVEGYALDYYPGMDKSEPLQDEDISNWYTDPLGVVSPYPVKTTLTDVSAHAWIEIYKDGYGWVPVELTPSASSVELRDDSEKTAFAEQLMTYFMNTNNNTQNINEQNNEIIRQKTAYMGLYTAIIAFCLLSAYILFKILRILLRHAMRLYVFSRKDSAAVIAIYTYLMDVLLFNKKLKGTSHRDMAEALGAYTRSSVLITETVEKILYSPEKPDEEQCENTFITLHGILNKVLGEKGFIRKMRILTKF